MSRDNSAAARRLELYFDSVNSADTAGTSSTQPTHPAGAPAVLGPYGWALAGSPATRIVGQPTTDGNSQSPDAEQQYPGLSAVVAQPFSVRLGGMAEASHQSSPAGPVASPMRFGRRPPTATIQDQASHLVICPIPRLMAAMPPRSWQCPLLRRAVWFYPRRQRPTPQQTLSDRNQRPKLRQCT